MTVLSFGNVCLLLLQVAVSEQLSLPVSLYKVRQILHGVMHRGGTCSFPCWDTFHVHMVTISLEDALGTCCCCLTPRKYINCNGFYFNKSI